MVSVEALQRRQRLLDRLSHILFEYREGDISAIRSVEIERDLVRLIMKYEGEDWPTQHQAHQDRHRGNIIPRNE